MPLWMLVDQCMAHSHAFSTGSCLSSEWPMPLDGRYIFLPDIGAQPEQDGRVYINLYTYHY